MRRITVWITATLAVLAFVIAYELNLSAGAKEEVGPAGAGPVATATCQAGSSCPAPSASPGGTSTSTANPGTGTSVHSSRPGENK